MKQLEIWSDGSCSRNPGPGGWAYVIKMGKHRKEMNGAEPDTTNNRMEMLAALKGLQALTKSCKVTLYSDSEYLCNGFNQNWVYNWENNNWRTKDDTEVKNQDLWEQLKEQDERHDIEWTWVKGHADNEENNKCDELAVQARMALQTETLSEVDQIKNIISGLRQGRSRVHAAHKAVKEKELDSVEEELFKSSKKDIAKLIRQLEAVVKGDSDEQSD